MNSDLVNFKLHKILRGVGLFALIYGLMIFATLSLFFYSFYIGVDTAALLSFIPVELKIILIGVTFIIILMCLITSFYGLSVLVRSKSKSNPALLRSNKILNFYMMASSLISIVSFIFLLALVAYLSF